METSRRDFLGTLLGRDRASDASAGFGETLREAEVLGRVSTDRRTFNAALVAALMSLWGCRGKGDSSKEVARLHSQPNPVSVPERATDEFSIPEMTFEKGVWKSAPTLFPGHEFEVLAEKIALKIEQAVDEYIQKKPGGDSRTFPEDPAKLVKRILLSIDPAFEQMFQTSEFSTPYAIVEYINKFLVSRGKYLYADFTAKDANLYDVSEYGEIKFNGENGGYYVELRNSSLVEHFSRKGGVLQGMPDTVMLWPDNIRQHSAEYVAQTGGSEESFVQTVSKATKFHEAGHVYLEDLFPRDSMPPNLGMQRSVQLPNGESIEIAGTFHKDQVQEVFGLGIELAKTDDVRLFATFAGTPVPEYELAAQLMILFMAESIPREDFQRIVASDNPQSVEFDIRKMVQYLRESQNIALVNEVGRKMYQEAIRAFKMVSGR